MKSEGVGVVRAINFQDLQPMTDPRMSQMDGRTHARTTCDCKTALCSNVRHTLKQRQTTGIAELSTLPIM